MKRFNLIVVLLFAVGIFSYKLYQKGIIFANFQNVNAKEAYHLYLDANTTLLDVRTKEELKKDGMIEGALHIPLQQLPSALEKLQPSYQKRVLIYCRSGNRSVTASRLLSEKGFSVYNLRGGIKAWKAAKLPVTKASL